MKQEGIDFPNNNEIDMTISNILEKAYPKNKSVMGSLISMYRQIGLRNILHGMVILMGLVFLCYSGIIIWEMNAVGLEEGVVQLTMILFLPLVFQGILGFSILNEQEQNVYELGMTSRYTPYHLLSLRMLMVSVYMILLNGVICVILWQWNAKEDFIRIVFLPVTITLLYSVLYMKVLLGGIQFVRQALLYGMWAVIALFIKSVFPAAYEYILYQLPLTVHVIVWCLAIIALGKEMSTFINWNCKYNLYMGG